MDPNHTDEVIQESKRIKVDEMSSNMESLMQQHKNLLENEYLFLETQLNGFKNRFDQSKKLLMRFISHAASPQLEKRIDDLKDIQKKQEILYQDLDTNLHSIRNEAFQVHQKEIMAMSPSDIILYFKHRINFLQKMQISQKLDNHLAGESCSTQDYYISAELVQEGSLTFASSNAQSPASELSPSQAVSAVVGQHPLLLLHANEEGRSMTTTSHQKHNKDYIFDPLQFQLRRLAQYQAMKDCPLHYKFIQKLRYANDLILLQHEQLLITSALQQEIWHLKEKEMHKTLEALVSPSLENVQEVVNLPTVPSLNSQNQSGNMFSEIEPMTKIERKLKKQLKKEKQRQEKKDKCLRDPSRCQFFVSHKKRYCRMLVVPKKLYCGQHLVMDQVPDDDGNVRIPCPLDPKHSVYQHQLAQHLAVCNARPPTHLPYYCADRNCGPLHMEEEEESIHMGNMNCAPIHTCEFAHKAENSSNPNQCDDRDVSQQGHLSLAEKSLVDVTDEELLTLIKRVMTAEKESTEPIGKEELLHSSMQDQLQNKGSSLGSSVRKHLLQNASLVAHLEAAGAFVGRKVEESAHMEKLGNNTVDTEAFVESSAAKLLDKDCKNHFAEGLQNRKDSPSCFLEFGAGKGQLSHWVVNASSSSHSLQTVLIDRGSQRYKLDSRINEAKHVCAVRLRVDIADLALERVEGVQLTGRVFAGGKHLCGAATDLSVRCLLRSGVLPACIGPRGLVIALCCHHRCMWRHYTGKNFLERVGLGECNFPALVGLSSWAVCKARLPVGATGAPKWDVPRPDPVATNPATVSYSLLPSNDVSSLKLSDGRTSSDASQINDAGDNVNTSSTSLDTRDPRSTLHNTLSPNKNGDEPESSLAEHDIEREDVVALNRYVRLGLSIAEREEIGRAAKHLIDHGRLLHLRQLGLKAKLVYYVNREVTLENVAIVAHS